MGTLHRPCRHPDSLFCRNNSDAQDEKVPRSRRLVVFKLLHPRNLVSHGSDLAGRIWHFHHFRLEILGFDNTNWHIGCLHTDNAIQGPQTAKGSKATNSDTCDHATPICLRCDNRPFVHLDLVRVNRISFPALCHSRDKGPLRWRQEIEKEES